MKKMGEKTFSGYRQSRSPELFWKTESREQNIFIKFGLIVWRPENFVSENGAGRLPQR